MNLKPFINRVSPCLAGAVLAMVLAPRVLAIDPLPPSVQNASPEVQKAYREKLAQESLHDKLEVGKQRFQERQKYRQGLTAMMRHEAAVRNEALNQSGVVASPVVAQARPSSSMPQWFFFLGMLAIGAVWLRSRNAEKRTGSETAFPDV
jgi:hypothetical protein